MMSSYQHNDSHHKDKMVSQSSYLYNGNNIPGAYVTNAKRLLTKRF